MWESVNIEKAAPGPLKATLNPRVARNRKIKAELLQFCYNLVDKIYK